MEWRPADFSSVGAFEICLLLGIGLALLRGITLPPTRILLLLGLLHMALAQGRAAEILALLAPMVLAVPLARQIGGAEASPTTAAPPSRGALFARRRDRTDGGNGGLCLGAPLRAQCRGNRRSRRSQR